MKAPQLPPLELKDEDDQLIDEELAELIVEVSKRK